MKLKKNTSILLSVFNRNGTEGIMTKIITGANDANYQEFYINKINIEENPLIISISDRESWFLLTDERILIQEKELYMAFYYSDIEYVGPSLKFEYEKGVTKLEDFTILTIQPKSGTQIILKTEKGSPYWGILAFLRFAIS